VVEADGDPDALMCRLKVLARMGRLSEARDDAIVIAQNSPNQIPAMLRIVTAFKDAAQAAVPAVAEGLMSMASQFQVLVQEAMARAAGR
jgi:hypothetical protein